MKRKEFKKLLSEWKSNFINEKTIPQVHNIHKLGHDKDDKKSDNDNSENKSVWEKLKKWNKDK